MDGQESTTPEEQNPDELKVVDASITPCILVRRQFKTEDGQVFDDLVIADTVNRECFYLVQSLQPLKISDEESEALIGEIVSHQERMMARAKLMTRPMGPLPPMPGSEGPSGLILG